MGRGVADAKLGGLGPGAAKAPEVDIADARMGANGADAAANAHAVAVADAGVGNDGAGVENASAIGVAGDCLEGAGGTAA